MNQPIKWRALGATAWVDDIAVLKDGLSPNQYAISTNKGFVTMDRNGTTRYSQTLGKWEGTYSLDNALPILRIRPEIVTYVLEIVER